MKKYLVGIGMSAMLAAANVSADVVSGDLQLRDAMYLYDQGVDARGSKTLGSSNCDVFQLVLDVTSGYTDLGMNVGNVNPLNSFAYPDRIHDSAAMFAYALSGNDTWKGFGFNDKGNLASSAQVGKGTIFGYCYSTKPDAYVYFRESDKCTVKYSDGSTESIPDCVPSPGSSPVPTQEASGSPSAPYQIVASSPNPIYKEVFFNHYQYALQKGEKLYISTVLNQPLSDQQKSRCSGSPATVERPSSYDTQIHVYNSSFERVGGICGENLTFEAPESGVYIFHFDFGAQSAGVFYAARI